MKKRLKVRLLKKSYYDKIFDNKASLLSTLDRVLKQVGPNPVSIESGVVKGLPHLPHLPSCQTSI